MEDSLSLDELGLLGTRTAALSVLNYALPVRFRIRGQYVECLVPMWAGVGERLEETKEAVLLAVAHGDAGLRWFFARGTAARVAEADWDGIRPPGADRVSLSDLYEIVRIRPQRLELVDEERGWGYRQTMDM